MDDNNAKELLELAETISLLGTWEINLETNKVVWSDGSFKICGYQPNEFEITLESGLSIIHPDDRALAIEKINDAIEKGTPYEIRKRFITKDNRIIHILSKGIIIKDKEGKSIKLCGVFQDITNTVKLEEEYQSAINELKSGNEFIETIVEHLPIGIAVNKISTGEATMINSSFASIYGWPDKDLKNIKAFFEKVYPDEAYRKEIMARVMSDMESGDPARMNWENITVTTAKNEKRIINAKNIPVFDQDLMISTVVDVTERINSTEKYKYLFQNNPAIMVVFDFETLQIVDCNDAALKKYGYSRSEFLSLNIKDIRPKEDVILLKDMFANEETYFKFLESPIRNQKKNGDIFYIKISSHLLDYEGRKCSLIQVIDVTEQLFAEENLIASETKYKQLFEDNPVPMVVWDFETKNIVDCNEEALYQYGYNREEFLKLSILDIRPEEDIQLIKNFTKEEQPFGYNYRNIWRHQKKSGELMYVNVTGHIVNFNGRKSSLVMLIDMTKQIEAEEQKEFEKRDKEALINSTNDLIWSVDLDFKLIAANQSFYNYLDKRFDTKISPGEIVFSKDKFSEEILTFWEASYKEALQGNIIKEFYTPKQKNHPEKWYEVTFNPIYSSNKIIGIACFFRNITDIKLADLEIKKNQKNLAEAQRLAKIGSWEFDIKSEKFSWSEEIHKIFDIDKTTFDQNNNGSFVHFIDPEYQNQALEISKRVKETGKNYEIEYRITTTKGDKKVLYEMGYGEKNEVGEVIRFFGTVQDITERKLAEERIAESELKYRSFFINSMDGILLTITDGRILAANPAACEIFQMTEAEIIEKGRFGLVDLEDSRLYELLERRKTQGSARGEITLIRKDGSKFEGELASVMFLDAQGRETTSMILRDITREKQYESEIKENNQRFEYVTRATSDAIWDWHLESHHIYWGNGFYQLFGYSENTEQNSISFWENNIHPDDLKGLEEGISRVIEGTESKWSDEYRFKKADGNYAYIVDQGFVIRDKDGKAIRMVGAMSDITQKKLEEERLKLLESVITNTNDSVMITEAEPFDHPGPKIVYVNEAFSKMTGYSAEDVMGKTPRILQGPLTDQNELKRLSTAIRNWKSCEVTTINYKKNGEPFWAKFSVSPVADKTGCYTHFIAVERDVTEQKIVEENLKHALLEKNEILESIGDGFFAINYEWTVTYWNKQAEEMLGISKNKIIGHYLWNVFSDRIDSDSYIKYHQAMTEHKLVRFEDYFIRLDKWYEISIYPSNNGLSVYVKDISERVTYTKAIEERNIKLKEIAYTQSHIVRAPLARILGLINLIDELKSATTEGKELLNYINISATELDDVIRDIVSKTEDI